MSYLIETDTDELANIANGLFDKLRSRFSSINLGDENGKATDDPSKARFFNFDFKINNNKLGNISISIIDKKNLRLFYSQGLTAGLDASIKQEWYDFLQELKKFATSNMLTFEPRDITKPGLGQNDVDFMSNNLAGYSSREAGQMFENKLTGNSKKSYQKIGETKLIIMHSVKIDETVPGARSRKIDKIFIENKDGERFKFPYKSLSGARAMTRHIQENGTPYDVNGQHILSLVNEMNHLSKFVRYTRTNESLDSKARFMVRASSSRQNSIRECLKSLVSEQSYSNYFANFKQAQPLNETDVDSLKQHLVRTSYDTRIDETLPFVYQAYQMLKENTMLNTSLVDNTISAPGFQLILRANPEAEESLVTSKFTNNNALLSHILGDIAARAIGTASLDPVVNFASEMSERIAAEGTLFAEKGDAPEYKSSKLLAVKLARIYLDDIKKMKADPGYASSVRLNPKSAKDKVGVSKKQNFKKAGKVRESIEFEKFVKTILDNTHSTPVKIEESSPPHFLQIRHMYNHYKELHPAMSDMDIAQHIAEDSGMHLKDIYVELEITDQDPHAGEDFFRTAIESKDNKAPVLNEDLNAIKELTRRLITG